MNSFGQPGSDAGVRRFLPIAIPLLLLLALGSLYGPGMYRSYLFRRDVERMLQAARAGNTAGMVAAVDPAQRTDVEALLKQYLPADYGSKIARLSLTDGVKADDQTRYAMVICRLSDGDGLMVYQGKLRWVWDGQRWQWDFFGSYAAPFTPAGEPHWQKIDDVVPEASGY